MNLKLFTQTFRRREGIFAFTTDHQEKQRIFRCEDDFTYGVNTLAIGALKFHVRVLCYVLMDNHLHLLVKGSPEDCAAYFKWVLHRLALMLKARYGISGLLKVDASDVQVVTDNNMFLNEVAYQLRNSYKARMASPFSYPWAPFEVYFNPYLDFLKGECFRSPEVARQILGTHADIPADWEHVNGRITNKCFVDYRTVEELFGSSVVFFDRVRKYDTESIIAQAHGMEDQLTFTDSEMQEKILAVCRNEWHVDSPHQLNRKDLLQLARTLARRFGASKKQLSRLLGIDPQVLDQVL